MQIYYSNQNREHCIYVDSQKRSQRIFLPQEVSPVDASYFASSETAKHVIKQLIARDEQ